MQALASGNCASQGLSERKRGKRLFCLLSIFRKSAHTRTSLGQVCVEYVCGPPKGQQILYQAEDTARCPPRTEKLPGVVCSLIHLSWHWLPEGPRLRHFPKPSARQWDPQGLNLWIAMHTLSQWGDKARCQSWWRLLLQRDPRRKSKLMPPHRES